MIHADRPARIARLAAMLVALVTAALPGHAAEPGAAQPLRVALNKAEVIHLGNAASVVLVASPRIADVILERGNLLFVLGKRPGETRLYVYSHSGRKLLERDIVVVPSHERTVTVTRGTRTTDYGCDGRCAALGFNAGVDASPGEEETPAAPAPATAAPSPTPAAAVTTPSP